MRCPKCKTIVKTNTLGFLECPECGYKPNKTDALNEAVRAIKGDKPKIELPPKVKCWECDGKGSVDVGGYKDINRCPFCERGERYVFDDLAAKAREAGLGNVSEPLIRITDVSDPNGSITGDGHNLTAEEKYQIVIPTKSGHLYGYGPNPTTALLMAIERFNSEVNE